jgi:uncharacterized membrane protein
MSGETDWLTPSDVKELITYDPVTGKAWHNHRDVKWFKNGKQSAEWVCKRWNSTYAGKEIVRKDFYGYISPVIKAVSFKLHRLIWAYMTGEWPKGDIDHINGKRDDNRWENLRDVSRSQNLKNSKKRMDNASGVTGICKDSSRKKWIVTITSKGKTKYLGRFSSFEEAVEKREKANLLFGFDKMHGKR